MRLGVLAGAFNPLTRAHLALIDSARNFVDQVVCVVPRAYPHKSFEGAGLEDRIAMLEAAKQNYEITLTNGGLFLDIASELRQSNPSAEIHFVCGRDAAERILTWTYEPPHTAESMLNQFSLLVASRQGDFTAPTHLASSIRTLPIPPLYDADSSTEVRRRIAAGEPWEHLVPDSIVPIVRRIYTAGS